MTSPDSDAPSTETTFADLQIHPEVLRAVADVGYETPSPIQAAILAGDIQTGVTIMQMDAEMDHGPILAWRELGMTNVKNQMSKTAYPELHDKLARLGAELLIEILPRWIGGEIAPMPQDETQTTYCKLLTKNSGRINWERPAEEIERMIRAYHPWPGTWTIWETNVGEWRIRIENADVVDVVPPAGGTTGTVWQNEKHPLLIKSGHGSLAVKKLGLEGKSITDAPSFIRGHLSLIGTTLA